MDTRTTCLENIFKDIKHSSDGGKEKILWIHGSAASGKTSIAHSVVELCSEEDIVITTFFFDRSDPTRNNIRRVVPTIAYQLIQKIPAMKAYIISRVADDPEIFATNFDIQFQRLVIEPLQRIGRAGQVLERIVLLFDGLDECLVANMQSRLIHTIAKHIGSNSLPMTALITSRHDFRLSMLFKSKSNVVCKIDLDTSYPAQDDIIHYLVNRFDTIKATNPIMLSSMSQLTSWPLKNDFEELLRKCSGQFICAARSNGYHCGPFFISSRPA